MKTDRLRTVTEATSASLRAVVAACTGPLEESRNYNTPTKYPHPAPQETHPGSAGRPRVNPNAASSLTGRPQLIDLPSFTAMDRTRESRSRAVVVRVIVTGCSARTVSNLSLKIQHNNTSVFKRNSCVNKNSTQPTSFRRVIELFS
jgi:hypothetical protein